MEKVEEKGGRVVVTTTTGQTVEAGAAVIATNSPINDRTAIHTKQAPYRTYAMAFEVSEEALPDALYWDTLDDYHYVRLHRVSDKKLVLIVGGGDHKSGEKDDGKFRFEALEAWMRALLPDLGKETHRWSGQVMETIDYTSFTGATPPTTMSMCTPATPVRASRTGSSQA